MLDLGVSRKNKINLEEYDYQADIQNRLLMSSFDAQDVEVLEEILFGSIRIPMSKLVKNLDLSIDELMRILQKLEKTKLFKIEEESILIDKEKRKYYDFQVLKYDQDFKPNMNYIQGILKKLPIHILPIWYAVPRSSNNIFSSLIERYFVTPQVYERYLLDLNLNEPNMAGIVEELFNDPSLQLDADWVCKKYELTPETFQEYMLHFEFNFMCCNRFIRDGDHYREVITPFYEWNEYLMHRHRNRPVAVEKQHSVESQSNHSFQFVQDLTFLLEEIIHQPITLKNSATDTDFIIDREQLSDLLIRLGNPSLQQAEIAEWQIYFSRLASRLTRLGLAVRHEDTLCPHHNAPHWLNMETEDKALYLYRHPNNRILKMGFSETLDTEKNVKEVEKSLERIQDESWYLMDQFLEGVTCAIGHNDTVSLTKNGPEWCYKLPTFEEDERQFMHYVIMQRLYEVGMVAVGQYEGKDCFKLLPFGRETLC